MIAAVVLAAGESRRMGEPKMLMPYGNTTVVQHIVSTLEQTAIHPIIVVTGAYGDEIASNLAGFRATIVPNPEYLSGMLSSVRTGFAAVPDAEGILIALGDQPSILPAWVTALAGAFARHRGICVPSYDSRRGHPILVDTAFRNEIMTEFDDVGLRGLLHRHQRHVTEVAVNDPAILADMDTQEDYRREVQRHANRGLDV